MQTASRETPTAPLSSAYKHRRLAFLDLLRLGAALSVVVFHFTSRPNQAFGTDIHNVFPRASGYTLYGAVGVELFFIISGFVILRSVWGRSTSEFVASRVARLFPAYWCAVVTTGAMMLIWRPDVLGPKFLADFPTFSEAIANLTMVQSAVGAGNVDGVYWTLFVELRFYVLVAVLALVGLNRQRVIAFATLWPILAGLAEHYDAHLMTALLCGDYAVFFSAGMLMYLVYRDGHSVLLWLLIGMQWAIALQVGATTVKAQLARASGAELRSWPVMLAVTCCFALVALATLTPASRFSWRGAALLGGLTYPLYLIHSNWGWVLISQLHPRIGQLPALAVTLVAVLIGAAAIHLLVERPLMPRLLSAVKNGLEPVMRLPRHQDVDRPPARGPRARDTAWIAPSDRGKELAVEGSNR